MRKLFKYYFIIIILIPCINSCIGWDGTKELTGGYFLRVEGDILSFGKGKQEIQPNVLRYNYNDDFIIAEQKPYKTNEAIYEKVYDYKYGRNHIYYWIIIIKKDSLLGPLSKSEFELERNKYKVPSALILKPID